MQECSKCLPVATPGRRTLHLASRSLPGASGMASPSGPKWMPLLGWSFTTASAAPPTYRGGLGEELNARLSGQVAPDADAAVAAAGEQSKHTSCTSYPVMMLGEPWWWQLPAAHAPAHACLGQLDWTAREVAVAPREQEGGDGVAVLSQAHPALQ